MTANTRPQARTHTARRATTPPVNAVRPVAAARTGGTAFMWLVAAIALASALCLLVLNTLRSEQAFTLTSLQSRVAQLDDQQQALQSDISALSAPEAIAMKADSLGLVHASSVRFVQRSNGKLLGVSTSPQAGTSIAVNTLPQSAASAAASDVLAAGGIGTHVGNTSAPAPNSAQAAPKAAMNSTGSAAVTPKSVGRSVYGVHSRTQTTVGTPTHRRATTHLPAQAKKK